jgi:hypothetical protein
MTKQTAKIKIAGTICSGGLVAYLAWANLWFPMTIGRVVGRYWCDTGGCGTSLDIKSDQTFIEYDGANILSTGTWSLETGLEPALHLTGTYPLDDPHIAGWREGGAVSYLLAMRHWKTCLQINEDVDEVHWCREK